MGSSSSCRPSSSLGTLASSPLVYGCLGESKISSVVPVSMIRPAYMTAIRIRHPSDDPQVVCDQEMTLVPKSVAQLPDEVQDLGLNRHVEGRGGLVCNQQGWFT